MGKLVLCTMPYKWAVEYVCDMLAASKVYGGKAFKKDIPVAYFRDHAKHYYMTEATRQFIDWCLGNYATSGWAHLHKKETLAKYREITAKLPRFETLSELHPTEELPNC